jgi:hypothetical protein
MRGPIGSTRQLSRVAPRRSINFLSTLPFGPCVMFVSASRSLVFGVTHLHNFYIYIYGITPLPPTSDLVFLLGIMCSCLLGFGIVILCFVFVGLCVCVCMLVCVSVFCICVL